MNAFYAFDDFDTRITIEELCDPSTADFDLMEGAQTLEKAA